MLQIPQESKAIIVFRLLLLYIIGAIIIGFCDRSIGPRTTISRPQSLIIERHLSYIIRLIVMCRISTKKQITRHTIKNLGRILLQHI